MGTKTRKGARGPFRSVTDANIAELEPIWRPYLTCVGPGVYVVVTAAGTKTFVVYVFDPDTKLLKARRLGTWGVGFLLADALQKAAETADEAALLFAKNRGNAALGWPAPWA